MYNDSTIKPFKFSIHILSLKLKMAKLYFRNDKTSLCRFKKNILIVYLKRILQCKIILQIIFHDNEDFIKKSLLVSYAFLVFFFLIIVSETQQPRQDYRILNLISGYRVMKQDKYNISRKGFSKNNINEPFPIYISILYTYFQKWPFVHFLITGDFNHSIDNYLL